MNDRKLNIRAFRGRVVSLLVLRPVGSYLSLFSRWTRKASAAMHRTQKKRFSFSRSLAYSICWDRLSLSFTGSFFTPSQFHKRFNLFMIRSTASLIGTEGGDSSKIQTDFLRAM